MNTNDAKEYLNTLLPDFNITIEEFYKGKPNNRYVFEKDGVDAAMLFAQKLAMTKEILQDVAAAVKKRFDTPQAIEKKLDAEENKTEAPAEQPKITEIAGKPSELEFNFYKAARKVVADFERKYPMT